MQQGPFIPSIQAINDRAMFETALPPYGRPCPSMETPGVLQDKIHQVQKTSQAPLPLAILAGLATSAFLIQGVAKVKKPNGQIVPISLFCISIAESGERKSTVLKAFTDPIDTFLAEQTLQEKNDLESYQRDLEVWKATRKRLVRAIAKIEVNSADKDEADMQTPHEPTSRSISARLKERLIQHDQNKPAPPKSVGMALMSDATPATIAHHVSRHKINSLGILTSEGDEFFSRGIKQDPTLFNNAWSGDPTRRHRVVHGDQSILSNISIGASLQPLAAEAIFNDRNKKLRSSGCSPRALFAFPPSQQGFRTANQIVNDDLHDDIYQQRVDQLLKLNKRILNSDNLSETVLNFTPEAQEHWFRLQWETEIEIRPGGRYFAFRDHASKLSDNAARVSSVLHVMEHGLEGEISLSTLRQAIDICAYCSDEFLRLFHEPPQEEVDATKLGNWMFKKNQAGYRYIRKSFVLTHGPLKPTARLDIALNLLLNQQTIGIWNYQGQTATGRLTKPTIIIDLCPSFQPDYTAMWQVAYAY